MIVFADSSAIVTAYAPAENEVMPTNASVVVSALARVEVVSALWRKAAIDEVSFDDAARAVRRFEADWRGVTQRPRFEPIALVEAVLGAAAALTATHGLRSLDAIQLACASAARAVEPECRTMVVLDERLRRAAALEGFVLLPVA